MREHPLRSLAAALAAVVFGGVLLAAAPARAADTTPAEAAFVARVAKALLAAYPTAVQAEKAGYVQTTGVDEDGTAIYFDHDFAHVSALHPNFLWYDRQGKLVGLDYEYPQANYPKTPTSLYPVAASRWTVVHEHVHFAYRIGAGPVHLRGARAYPNLRTPHITAADLAADHLLPAGATMVWAYHHPTCWDLGFWLVPNPNGPFAEANPDVK
ncbi:MAG TPA: hypothetical protein VNJ51_14595 [Candidatus Dormibacteraeota bacterium]|nr:hypothetical protein [Candidatus Dormibacteraeota bacterium]